MSEESKRGARTPESRAQHRAAHAAARKAHLADIKARKAKSKERAKESRFKQRWTAEEDRVLSFRWGEASPGVIAAGLGRPVRGVIARALLLKLPPASRGTHTLTAISDETGYSWMRIVQAAARLGIELRRAYSFRHYARWANANHRHYAITDEEREAIVTFLAAYPDGQPLVARGRRVERGLWGVGGRPSACLGCGTTSRPHQCKGQCKRCYDTAGTKRRRAAARQRTTTAPPQAEPQRRAA